MKTSDQPVRFGYERDVDQEMVRRLYALCEDHGLLNVIQAMGQCTAEIVIATGVDLVSCEDEHERERLLRRKELFFILSRGLSKLRGKYDRELQHQDRMRLSAFEGREAATQVRLKLEQAKNQKPKERDPK